MVNSLINSMNIVVIWLNYHTVTERPGDNIVLNQKQLSVEKLPENHGYNLKSVHELFNLKNIIRSLRSRHFSACCSVMQRVAACCSVGVIPRSVSSSFFRVAVCCSVLQCAAACCSVLHCVAITMCCILLQRVAVYCNVSVHHHSVSSLFVRDAVCCSVL